MDTERLCVSFYKSYYKGYKARKIPFKRNDNYPSSEMEQFCFQVGNWTMLAEMQERDKIFYSQIWERGLKYLDTF